MMKRPFTCFSIILFLVVCVTGSITTNIPTGGNYKFNVDNYPLIDWSRLHTMHSIQIKQLGSDHSPFKVLYSNSLTEIEKKIISSDSGDVHVVDCPTDTEGVCSFQLSPYGLHPYWWIPRTEYFMDPPPSIHFAIIAENDSVLGFSSKIHQYEISVDTSNEFSTLVIAFSISITLFFLSSYLSKSLEFYRLMWFIIGGFFSIGIVFVFIVYAGLSISPKLTSITGIFTLLIAVGGGSFYYNYLKEFIAHPAQHKIWLFFILIGGLTGVMFGYTDELTKRQSGQIKFFIKFLSFAIVIFVIPQLESGIIIGSLMMLILPIIEYTIPLLISSGSLRKKKVPQSPGMITMEEFVQEGIEMTQQSIEDLIEQYEKNPELLSNLSTKAQRRTQNLIYKYKRSKRRANKH